MCVTDRRHGTFRTWRCDKELTPPLRADSVHSNSHVRVKSDQTASNCNAFPECSNPLEP